MSAGPDKVPPGKPGPLKGNPKLKAYFRRNSILTILMKHMALRGEPGQRFSFEDSKGLLDTFLKALKIYMKTALKEIIERCEHRSAYHLHEDIRYELVYDMKAKMERLDERDRQEHCLSDDDDQIKRVVPSTNFGLGIARRLTTTNNTALDAIGLRMRQAPPQAHSTLASVAVKPRSQPQPQPLAQPLRPAAKRWKYICVADVIRFLKDDKRYAQTRLLIVANSSYEY
ncbi:uncharacterized protein nht [Drosophila pseudoobscura]|uniref:Uncharacterized protein nht n=1 Tax=Drosophila pseudoobscura pseudoobscura TaxID=46245 RepID=A0A6I8VYU3_DROPS|nr:uncharacterized protein LOC4816537 [Drosophila pseudoobscura]XP_033236237.1 uncharacterized protein LOC4816537 [Drosophila pseudoobscura]